ncbi:MAG: hypothetical protein ABI540_03210 [Spartobacteria bacterium]
MHHAKRHGWLEVKPKKPGEYLGQIVRWKDYEIAQFRAYRQKEIRELTSDTFTDQTLEHRSHLLGSEFAFAGCTPADAEKDGHQLLSASAESSDIGKLHLAGNDFGFGEFWTDTGSARLISASLPLLRRGQPDPPAGLCD